MTWLVKETLGCSYMEAEQVEPVYREIALAIHNINAEAEAHQARKAAKGR